MLYRLFAFELSRLKNRMLQSENKRFLNYADIRNNNEITIEAPKAQKL